MKKNYLRDCGKVRMCDANIAKMNIVEYIYYFTLRERKHSLIAFGEAVKEFATSLIYIIAMTLNLVLFPITLITNAVYHINRAKKMIGK